jgi:hypothetical protein
MRSTFLIVFIFFICALPSCAQEITMYKTFGGVRFERDTTVLSLKMVREILRENPLAFEEFNKAKVNYNVAGVLGFTGGLLIALPLTTSIVGGNPEWAFAAAGAGLVLASIQFNRMFKSRALNSLDIFNGKVATSRIKPKIYFNVSGAQLVVKF